MNFGLSEEQLLLKESVQRFVSNQVPLDRVRKIGNGSESQEEIWKELVELGITGLLIPESDGGVDLSLLDAAVVAEVLGQHVTPCPFLGTAIAAPLALRKSDHLSLLHDIATGNMTVGVAFGHSVPDRIGCGVTSDVNRLSGRSPFVIDFGASHYLVSDHQKALFLVDAQADGVEGQLLETVDQTRRVGELVLRDVPCLPISTDAVIHDALVGALRTIIAADTHGAAQAMLDKAVAYAMEREQFGRAIGSFQAVKHLCADMVADLEPCRAMLWYSAFAADSGDSDAQMVACHTKAHLCEVGKSVAKTATEVHGGIGFTDLLGLHYWFKRIGFNRQIFGTPEQLRREAAVGQGFCGSSERAVRTVQYDNEAL